MIDEKTIRMFLASTLEVTNFTTLGDLYRGKVRDVYSQPSHARSILITTDRQSAFDVSWCTIPLKGQALNQISVWWFDKVKDILPTHIIESPDPNVVVVKTLDMLKVEIVVRGYMTGSSKTSVWMNYADEVRDYCGNILPEGMKKNEPFASAIVTPTTKSEDDELISPAQIVERGLATADQWEEIQTKALQLFARGQEIAAERGLILVDTKYEMGYDREGNLTLADEVHTPDSSRYWVHDSYEKRMAEGLEPQSLDKEFFRLWLKEQGFEYGGTKPVITDDVRCMLALKYLDLHEKVTGTTFEVPEDTDVSGRIRSNLERFQI